MSEKVSFTYQTFSDWGAGFSAQITITNLTTASITNWELSFDWNVTITTLYTCKIKEKSGSTYTIYPIWDKVIAAGNSINVGFQGEPGSITVQPSNYKLICDEFGASVPLANITILEYSRSKLGKVTGTNKCTVTFKSDQPLIVWEARANGGTGAGIGLLVGEGGALLADAIGAFDVDTSELTLGDKEYTIKVYGKNTAGEWST